MKILMIGFNLQEDVFPLTLSGLKNYALHYHPDADIIIKEFGFGNRFSYDTNTNLELQVLSYIKSQEPDIVCFSAYIWSGVLIKNLCAALRKISNIKIAVGGPEADNSFKKYCDFLIIGEGEIKFKEVIDDLKNIKPYYPNKKIIQNLDDLPSPYANLDCNKSFTVMRIELSRGCPYKCRYCNYANKTYREFSLNYLAKNIDYIFNNFRFKHLTILDGNINTNKKRMKEIFRLISKHSRKIQLNIELNPGLIDEEVINIIKYSNLNINCELGLQSISNDVTKESNRIFDIETVKEGLKLLNKNKIKYKIDLMYGLPKDNFFKFLSTVNFIMKYSKQKILPAHHFMVLNNTEFENCTRFLDESSSMIIKTENQTVIDLYKQKLFIDMINDKIHYSKHVAK